MLSGIVRLKGVVSVDTVALLKRRAELVFAERDERAASDANPADLSVPVVRRFIPLDDLLPVTDVLPARALEIARSYLEHEPQPAPDRYVREIRPDRVDAHLPFHQDEAILKRRAVNVWFPLSRAGDVSPGLELVRFSQHLRPMEPKPVDGSPFAVEKVRLDENAVRSKFPRWCFFRPVVRPGDALVFSGATIHRTFWSETMTESRLSVEVRLV